MHQKRLRIQGLEINGNNLRFYETILPTNFIYSAFSAWHRHKMFAFFPYGTKLILIMDHHLRHSRGGEPAARGPNAASVNL